MQDADRDDIPPTARLFWMAHHFRISATYQDRYELECIDGYRNNRTLPREKVRPLKESGDLLVEPFYFDVDGKPAQSGSHVGFLATRSPSEQRRTMIAYTKAAMLQRAYKAGKVALYETQAPPKSDRRRRHTGKVTVDVWLMQNGAAIHAACRRFYILDPTAPRGNAKPRLGQFPYPSLGSSSTLKKDRAKLARKGFKITDLSPNIDGMRNGGRRMERDMANFMEASLREFRLRPERPSIALFRRFAQAQLRMIPDMAQRRVPSAKAIAGLIGTLNDAKVLAALLGEKVMTEAKTIYTEGLRYTYPGEMITMDCYKIDLVACLNDQGAWMFVEYDELKHEWGMRRRLWVAFAVDVNSRAILGLALGLSENTQLTRRALRMVVSDKTAHCRDAGCTGAPLPAIGVEGLLTDIGGAFQHPYFQVPALTLASDTDIGPGDNAHLRGIQERVNRTFREQLLSFFTGPTFGNVIARGNYDSMGRASVDVKTLGRVMWGWANDVYNRTQHRGLDGQTPYDRFHETLANEGAAEPYTEEKLRLAFGLQFDVPVTREGIWFAGNRYVSGRLQNFFANGPKKGRKAGEMGRPMFVRLMIDPCDLGRASAFFDGEWHILAGPARMRRVGLTDWFDTRRALAARFSAEAEVHAPIVAEMLLRLEREGTEARLRSQVRDMAYDSEEVARAVNKIKLRIKEDETPMQQGAVLAFDTGSTEASFPATGIDDTVDGTQDVPDIEAAPDPYGADGPTSRPETDFGLDDVDIDRDGDPLDDDYDEDPRADDVHAASVPASIDDQSDEEPERPPKTGRSMRLQAKPTAFLPQPETRNDK